jgi:hypothetical protein
MRSLRHPATIVSVIALGVALTGTAGAITMINGAQIRNGTITGAKLRNLTVTGTKVQNHSLTWAKLTHPVIRVNAGDVPTVAPGTHGVWFNDCPRGWTAIGGGYTLGTTYAAGMTAYSASLDTHLNGYAVEFSNQSTPPQPMSGVQVSVTCLQTP